MSTIKRRQSEYKGFTIRLETTGKPPKQEEKSLYGSGTTSHGRMREISTCTRMLGREECGGGKELLMIRSILPHLMAWACMAASEIGSLSFTNDVTADRSSRMNSQVYRAILSAQIQLNASKLIGCRIRLQMDKDPKHISRQPQTIYARHLKKCCHFCTVHPMWMQTPSN